MKKYFEKGMRSLSLNVVKSKVKASDVDMDKTQLKEIAEKRETARIIKE